MPDDPQPAEGQGDAGSGGLFDSYLATVPEDQRASVESYLKDASKQVEKKEEEAAEVRKNWEPYENIRGDLSQYDPEELQQLIAWHQQITGSPEAYQQWLGEAAKEAGLNQAQTENLEEEAIQEDLTPQQVEKRAEEIADQRIAPIAERLDAFEQTQAVNEMQGQINSEFALIEKDTGALTDEQKAAIIDLGEKSDRDDWVQAGADRLKEIGAEANRLFVDDKANAPKLPLTGGGQERTEAPKTFEEAKLQALGRLAQAKQG